MNSNDWPPVTHAVRHWLETNLPADPSLVADFMEVKPRIIGADDDVEAAGILSIWLHERLIVRPGMVGSFAPLAERLLDEVLTQVDWIILAMWIRQGIEGYAELMPTDPQ